MALPVASPVELNVVRRITRIIKWYRFRKLTTEYRPIVIPIDDPTCTYGERVPGSYFDEYGEVIR